MDLEKSIADRYETVKDTKAQAQDSALLACSNVFTIAFDNKEGTMRSLDLQSCQTSSILIEEKSRSF